jgi:GNAT superfamily N-acetyltransferase
MPGKPVAQDRAGTSPWGMDVRLHQDPRTFTALAESFYATDTLRHTVALTVMARILGSDRKPEPTMATLHDDNGALIGASFRTPPWPIIASGLPTEPALLDEFLDRWLTVDPELPRVTGPRENADALAQAWIRRTGGVVREKMATRLFRLGDLAPPVTSGRPRNATEDDIDLLVGWRDDFETEAIGRARDPGSSPAAVRRMLEMGDTALIWENGGKPVAWAAASVPIRGMSRVGPVYTPPAHRARGYGSAVTAAVSQRAREAGARDVILFTDLANPTSNSIYQKLGYRPVYDSTELEFTRLPSTT